MLVERGPWSPWIHGTGDGPRPDPWRKPWRRLPWWLLVVVAEGRETVHLPDRSLSVAAGGAYAIPPGQRHALESPGNRPVWIHMELAWHGGRGAGPSAQPDARGAFAVDLPVAVPAAQLPRWRRDLPRIAARWAAGGPLERAAASLDAGALLLAWAAAAADQGPAGAAAPARLARAEAAARADPAGCDLVAMAAAAGLRRSRFCALWRAERGAAPGMFLRRCRLDAAAALLADTDLPLAAVAVRCGFNDAPALVRAVRRDQGCTPAAWRERLRRDGA
ncbi:MAG: hypothetical protein RLZZ127_2013 [Planctomycetota bacterium]|jgi:AraC-like DNA-binding protein